MNRELLKTNFEKRGYIVKFFDTKEEAAAYLESEIKGVVVATGGSMTLAEMNIPEILSKNNEYLSHTPRDDFENFKKELAADAFLCSANGVAETGEMVNIDGTGNRLVGTLYGHQRMYYVIGKNKICPTLEAAMDYAKNVAAPKNCVRLNKKTPCAVTGKCANCDSPDRICKATVIYERAMSRYHEEVLFVDEELGY